VPDDPSADDADAGPTPVRVRCETCRSVVSTRHAWDSVTCACGSLTVSGRPTKPRVAWVARPGGGWSEAHEGVAAEGDEPDDEASDAAPPASRPIGFAP
jgi:hypothetical protein